MKKQFTKTDKKGREETWEWEATPEATKALERIHAEMRENNSDKKPKDSYNNQLVIQGLCH